MGSHPPAPKRPLYKRWTVWVALAVALAVLACIVAWPSLRQRAGGYALAQVSELLVGDFHADRVAGLSLTGVELEGVRIDGPDGEPVITARRLQVGLALGKLLQGEIAIEPAVVEGVHVSLRGLPDAPAIADAFMPADDTPPDPAEEEEPSSLRLSVSAIQLRDVSVEDLPEAYALSLPEVLGEVHYGPAGTTVEAKVPALKATRAKEEVASGGLAMTLALVEDATSTVEITLTAGESSVSAKVSTTYTTTGDFTLPSGALHAHLHPSLLPRVGYAQYADSLRAPVDLDAELDAATRSATLRAHTPGGDLELTGGGDDDAYHGRVTTRKLDLRPVLGPDVPAPLAGDVSLTLGPAQGPDGLRDMSIVAKGVRVADWRQPHTTLHGALSEHDVRVHSLSVPAWTRNGGHMRVAGRSDFEGDARASVDVGFKSPMLGGLLERDLGVRGDSLALKVKGRYRHASGRVDAAIDLVGDNLAASEVSAQQVSAHIQAKGSVLRPSVDAHIQLEQMRVPNAHIRRAEIHAVGAGGQYQSTLLVQGKRAQLEGHVHALVGSESVRVDGDMTATGPGRPDVRLHLGTIAVQNGGVSLSGARLSSGAHYLSVEGHYHPRKGMDARAAMSGFDLASLSQIALLEKQLAPYALKGELSGNVRARGTPERPELDAELRGERLGLKGVELGALLAELHHSSRAGTTRLDLLVDPPTLDRLELKVSGDLPQLPVERALRLGRYSADINALMMDVAVLAPLAPEAMKTAAGGVDLRGTLTGSHGEGVAGNLTLSATRLATEQLGPASFVARLDLAEHQNALSLVVTDDEGELVKADVEVQAGVVDLVESPLDEVAWALSVSVPRRRLDELPPPARLDLPVRTQASASVQGTGFRLTQAEVTAQASYELPELEPGLEGCTQAVPDLLASVRFTDGQARLEGTLTAGPESVASFAGSSDLGPVALDTFALTGKDAKVAVSARGLRLETLPYLCGNARGTVDLLLSADGLLSKRPKLSLDASIAGLGGVEGPTLDLKVTGTADSAGVKVEAKAEQAAGEALLARGSLPWTWSGLTVPEDFGEPSARVTLNRLALEPLAAPFPDFARLRGHVSGSASVRGREKDWDIRGKLTLDDVYVGLASPALRLEHMYGDLRLDNKSLRFERLRWGDREGRMTTTGEVELGDHGPARADVRLQTEDLPLRNDGVVFANIDTDTRVRADFTREPAEVRVAIQDLTVKLPPDLTRSTQELDPHPDVVYVDAAPDEQEDEAATPGTSFIARVSIETAKPFWVRHEDFAVQIEPKLDVVTSEKGARISGPLLVRRGYVTLVGRTFSFERGQLRFDGGPELDPSIDITAKHKLDASDYVEVRIGGHLSKPTIKFHTNVAGVADNETEIMTLLVRGNSKNASTSPSAEAAAMLSGLTAGFLSSLTRGKYGDYVPLLALEAGSGTGTRLHAGIQMDDFIPTRMRRVVQGAYVEGYVGSGDKSGSSETRGSTGGILIELYLPHDLTTSGTWDEPTNWSLDVLWEPLR